MKIYIDDLYRPLVNGRQVQGIKARVIKDSISIDMSFSYFDEDLNLSLLPAEEAAIKAENIIKEVINELAK